MSLTSEKLWCCKIQNIKTDYRDFFRVPQGLIMGPCPSTKYPVFFSNLIKKIPNWKINLRIFINYLQFFFHLGVLYFII